MKLPTKFPALDNMRKKMGAPLSSWTLKHQPTTTTKPPIPVTSEDFPIRPLYPDEILVDNKGHPFLTYIKDARVDYQTLLNNPQESPRFHIAECDTIKRMRIDKRFGRYVKTYETKGDFWVEATDRDEPFETKLYVCKNCLNNLNIFGRYGEWPEFSIADLLRDYKPVFSPPPQYTDVTAPPGGYPKNWSSISTLYKNSKGWKCEKCQVDLNRYRSLLECHHISGVTPDNEPGNLQALCIECHSRQPQHAQVRVGGEQRKILSRLRAEQGIRPRQSARPRT